MPGRSRIAVGVLPVGVTSSSSGMVPGNLGFARSCPLDTVRLMLSEMSDTLHRTMYETPA